MRIVEVLKALAANPERTVPLIPYILTRISAPNIVSESQVRPPQPLPPVVLDS